MADLLHSIGERAKSIVAIGTIASVLVTGGWYILRLDERLRSLESQMQTLVVPPAGKATTGANPLAQACADLALRYADATSRNNTSAAYDIDQMIRKLGCLRP